MELDPDDLVDVDSGESLDILQNLHQLCRVCLQKGDINIWNFRAHFNEDDAYVCGNVIEGTEVTPIELMNIFVNSKEDIFVLSEVVSLICQQCLNDLKMCYAFYQKLKLASVTIKSLYQETGDDTEQTIIKTVSNTEGDILQFPLNIYENQTVIESPDTLIEIGANNSLEQSVCKKETFVLDNYVESDKSLGTQEEIYENEKHVSTTIDPNGTMVVAKFIPAIMESNVNANNIEQSGDYTIAPKQLTIDYNVVEIHDVSSLAEKPDANASNVNFMFKCKYCPRAFSRSAYLQTHARKSHLCKFCTKAFKLSQDLFHHLRTAHKDNKCVICHKSFTTNSNLRIHIKRMHSIELPANMVLIDFIHQ